MRAVEVWITTDSESEYYIKDSIVNEEKRVVFFETNEFLGKINYVYRALLVIHFDTISLVLRDRSEEHVLDSWFDNDNIVDIPSLGDVVIDRLAAIRNLNCIIVISFIDEDV